MTRAIWVAELAISASVATKIASRHGLSMEEVRDAVQCVKGLRGRADVHPDRGLRYLLDVTIRGRVVTVVLYPAVKQSEDRYALGSAYPV